MMRKAISGEHLSARAWRRIRGWLTMPVAFGRALSLVPEGTLVFFPHRSNRFVCGLAGMVAFRKPCEDPEQIPVEALDACVEMLEARTEAACLEKGLPLAGAYLGGEGYLEDALVKARRLKEEDFLARLFGDLPLQKRVDGLCKRLEILVRQESRALPRIVERLGGRQMHMAAARLEVLKDVHWCLFAEVGGALRKVADLMAPETLKNPTGDVVRVFRGINGVLDSIDRLEVRGRDSAGVSLLFFLDEEVSGNWEKTLREEGLYEELRTRMDREPLINGSVSIRRSEGKVSVALTYKIAAEIGRLGDNVRFLREQIRSDSLLQTIVAFPHTHHTLMAHTRWASVGAITEPNCHPVDNTVEGRPRGQGGLIHVCLNGDIDNFLQLREDMESRTGYRVPEEVTTDTKIIPLQVEKYLEKRRPIEEAFRLAVNDFEGSHAISMHSDLAPGKLFLAQRGSGQAIFVGLGDTFYMPSSEVYGFVEQTPFYVKLDGEKTVQGRSGRTQGQIFVLDQQSAGLEGITASYYDGTPITLTPGDIKATDITSRDIDRQHFEHYFLKEISEAPLSVERTLQQCWSLEETGGAKQIVLELPESVVPTSLRRAVRDRSLRRIFFVGQGTAGVAAKACADLVGFYLKGVFQNISAQKASEFSGFALEGGDGDQSLSDTLVVAVTQSGTTTDTNRTVDMVRERGAHTLAIVNRRDSDITFKVDGVMYTSSGRDIEMSVASTKAFYSQIVAGALLGLYMASLTGRRDAAFVAEEMRRLLALPAHMRTVLESSEKIAASARRSAVTRTHWAVVGSGPNKAAADEIRIKLSELCYKTISSDFVEDKKHIDLSSEPLILVCAAGSPDAVLSDIVKDTAIFRAHKAMPVVIADEEETRFDTYAEDVLHVPSLPRHLAPICNTLAGHLWGYHAALSINEGSQFLYGFREDLRATVENFEKKGMDIFEILLEKGFREKIAQFYHQFRERKIGNRFPAALGVTLVSDLTLLLKYLAGRLPVTDFELDFGVKGTPSNILHTLFSDLGEAINKMARPVDAIKHQAKTVTVGTSRIAEKVEGLLFDKLASYGFGVSQLTTRNVLVLKHLQEIVSEIPGSTLYRIGGLNFLGEPTEESSIAVVRKEGTSASLTSRVEKDRQLKGTKRIIVQQGNVYIGKGRKDERSIMAIPIISGSGAAASFIDYLLLLHVKLKDSVPLGTRIKALGGKFEHIKNLVQESSVPWDSECLNWVEMEDLFGLSAEKIAERIVIGFNANASPASSAPEMRQ